MEDGLLSLKWNNHRSTFFHVLAELREKSQYSDVTLACDGELFPTHRLVLSTCSDYFAAMLDSTQCKSPVIVLKDVKKDHLSSLLRYMYIGEVEVRQNDLSGLIKAAECLRIKGLAVPDQPPEQTPIKSSRKIQRAPDTSPSPKKRVRRDSGDSNRGSSVSSGPPPSKRVNSNNSENCESAVPTSHADLASPPNIKTECVDISSPPRSPGLEDAFPGDHVKVEQEEMLEQPERLGNNSAGVYKGEDRSCDMTSDSMPDGDDGYSRESDEKMGADQLAALEQMAGPSRAGDGSGMWHEGMDGSSFPHDLFDTGGEEMTQQQQQQMSLLKIADWAATGVLPFEGVFGRENSLSTDGRLQCPICPYTCIQKQSLKIHIRRHTGEKPFKCQFCDFRATQKKTLINHERRHTGERPFKCKYCDYSSTQNDTVKQHERKHTGEKPYKCKFCDYSAAQRSGLRYHVSSHHSELNNTFFK